MCTRTRLYCVLYNPVISCPCALVPLYPCVPLVYYCMYVYVMVYGTDGPMALWHSVPAL